MGTDDSIKVVLENSGLVVTMRSPATFDTDHYHNSGYPERAKNAGLAVLETLIDNPVIGATVDAVEGTDYGDLVQDIVEVISGYYHAAIPKDVDTSDNLKAEVYWRYNRPMDFHYGERAETPGDVDECAPAINVMEYLPRKELIVNSTFPNNIPRDQTPKQYLLTAALQHVELAKEFYQLANSEDYYTAIHPGNYQPPVEIVTSENEERINIKLKGWLAHINEE